MWGWLDKNFLNLKKKLREENLNIKNKFKKASIIKIKKENFWVC